ncbi:glycosyltransferase family protein [Desulforhabdus amnigena]|jgi:predicted glycosyltransferase|uniref:Membrane protein n=1 Tax=Desulforhabdus amnigena TaxID=40218 RepID=A0A9W6FTQ9_9BACT|nr:glycosyltransferase [Desulforhabdus amnigena]NLJ29818.1 glycosyltransferase [Deltaproteobacteria bacterium]GLI33906.1 membrane protein [Desulforhabdus amnigena]
MLSFFTHPKEADLNSSASYKILMYSHDTYGLGHIRRCLAIARSLSKTPANILLLTGSPLAGRFKIPGHIDFVRIPGMIKVTNEQYLPLSMKLDAAEVLEIRKSIILATAKAFRPDFFIVDKAPLGLKREVVDTLRWLKTDFPSCRSILGLRDIMDSAESTIEDWKSKDIYEAMDQLYDEIWVYGCRNFYDPIQEYAIPPHVAEKIYFTGYIPRHVPCREDIQITRRSLGISDNEKLIIVTTGGGGDGQPVVNTFLKAFDSAHGGIPERTRVVIVTGPFISPKDYKEVVKRCESLGFITLKFYRFMERLIGAAQVVVSMGGYNTVCEIASQRKPFLIVPRTVPREEQLIRAQVLCTKGFCDYLHPAELTPAALRQRVLALLHNGSSCREKMGHFPFTALEVIRKRILQHKGGRQV